MRKPFAQAAKGNWETSCLPQHSRLTYAGRPCSRTDTSGRAGLDQPAVFGSHPLYRPRKPPAKSRGFRFSQQMCCIRTVI